MLHILSLAIYLLKSLEVNTPSSMEARNSLDSVEIAIQTDHIVESSSIKYTIHNLSHRAMYIPVVSLYREERSSCLRKIPPLGYDTKGMFIEIFDQRGRILKHPCVLRYSRSEKKTSCDMHMFVLSGLFPTFGLWNDSLIDAYKQKFPILDDTQMSHQMDFEHTFITLLPNEKRELELPMDSESSFPNFHLDPNKKYYVRLVMYADRLMFRDDFFIDDPCSSDRAIFRKDISIFNGKSYSQKVPMQSWQAYKSSLSQQQIRRQDSLYNVHYDNFRKYNKRDGMDILYIDTSEREEDMQSTLPQFMRKKKDSIP